MKASRLIPHFVVFLGISIACASNPIQEFQSDGSTIALWHFNEGQGDSTFDASGHGNHGLIVGAAWTSGKFGNCLQFNGNSKVVVKDSPSLHLQTMTVEAWVYSSNFSQATRAIFVTKDYVGVSQASYRLQLWGTAGYVNFVTGQDWVVQVVDTPTVLVNGQWHLVGGVWSNDSLRIYIDSKLAGKVAKAGAITYDATALMIGACREVSSASFVGLIDEVRLSNIDRYASPVPVLIPCIPNPTHEVRPDFSWHSNDSISMYRIQLSLDPTFANPFVSLPTTDTTYHPSIDLPFDTIFWRVGNADDQRAWSPNSMVLIVDSSVPLLIPYAPDPTIERKPVLRWHSVHNGSPYTVQIDDHADFASTIVTSPCSDTFFAPTADLPIGKIFWRAKAGSSSYSNADTFTIQNDSIPILVDMPETVYNARPQFKWFRSSGAASYRIQIDTSGSFASPLAVVPVTDTSYTPGYSLPDSRIFWRVSSDVNLNRYSDVDVFLILPPTSTPHSIGAKNKSAFLSLIEVGAGQAVLSFEIPMKCLAQVDVYRLSGEHVARLFTNREACGAYRLQLTTKGWRHNASSAGNYLLTLRFGSARISRVVSLSR